MKKINNLMKKVKNEKKKLVIANEIKKNMHSIVNEQIQCSRRMSANKNISIISLMCVYYIDHRFNWIMRYALQLCMVPGKFFTVLNCQLSAAAKRSLAEIKNMVRLSNRCGLLS